MPSTSPGFDWWLLVVVPALVAIATYYFQKILDLTAISGFRRFNRRAMHVHLSRCQYALERVVDKTYHIRYQQLMWRLVITCFFGFITMAAARLPGSASPCDAMATTTQMAIGYVAFVVMMANAIYLGMLVTTLNEYYKIANNPVAAVTLLRKRALAHATPENDLAFDVEIITRLALRIQQQRDDLLHAARDNWSPEEIERHKARFDLGKQHIMWS